MADVIAIYCGRCYYHFLSVLFLADVIANVFVADVIATEADVIACNDSFSWLMLLPILYVADVIATKADVIAYKMVFWLMLLLISSRCYNHYIECVG